MTGTTGPLTGDTVTVATSGATVNVYASNVNATITVPGTFTIDAEDVGLTCLNADCATK
jgi:hypothetical protein